MSKSVASSLVTFVILLFVGACSSDKQSESSTADAVPTDHEATAAENAAPSADSRPQAMSEEPVAQEMPADEPDADEMPEDDRPAAEAGSGQPTATKEEPAATPAPTEEPPEPDVEPQSEPEAAPPGDDASPALEHDETEESMSSDVVVPSGPVRVEPAKEGLTYIGTNRCAMCHKVQHTSWLETEHAKLTPPLDCESCHGPGSEYKSKKTMEDPAAARSAGLVVPSAEFCSNCHVAGWKDEMLERTHAHKSSAGE